MSNVKSRLLFSVKGLGNCLIRQIEPTENDRPSDAGYLNETDFSEVAENQIVKDERGNVIQVLVNGKTIGINTVLQQTSKEEYDLIRNAAGKIFTIQYHGKESENMWKYFCLANSVIDSSVTPTKNGNMKLLPLKSIAIVKETDTLEYPAYYLEEMNSEILGIENLRVWLSPRSSELVDNTKNIAFDISGHENDAVLSNGTAVVADGQINGIVFDGSDSKILISKDFIGDFSKAFFLELALKATAIDSDDTGIFQIGNIIASLATDSGNLELTVSVDGEDYTFDLTTADSNTKHVFGILIQPHSTGTRIEVYRNGFSKGTHDYSAAADGADFNIGDTGATQELAGFLYSLRLSDYAIDGENIVKTDGSIVDFDVVALVNFNAEKAKIGL